MRRALVFAVLLFVGCCSSLPPQPPWPEVKNKLTGKLYEEIVACAGVPDSLTTVSEGTGAVVYRDYVSYGSAVGSLICEATMVVKEGHVVSVTQREHDDTTFGSKEWPNFKLCSKRFENCPWTR